jgi:adenine-specific DNA methylase
MSPALINSKEKTLGEKPDRRAIEETFPILEVSRESVREKNIRRAHISTLHIWWARLPLASCRATNYAALIQASTDPGKLLERRKFIAKLARWESSTDKTIIDEARAEISKATKGDPPKVLDPFGGGGSIPLEALRLGCDTYASDYNPVATLVLKAALEYPQRFAGNAEKQGPGLATDPGTSRLLKDLDKWGKWIDEQVRKEIATFYPKEADGSTANGYFWARTVPCQNPSCQSTIPLIKQFWLANRPEKKAMLCPSAVDRNVEFTIVGSGYSRVPAGFDPGKGTVSRAIATCIVCGSVMDGHMTRSLFAQGKASQRMLAVALRNKEFSGYRYRSANNSDSAILSSVQEYLDKKRDLLLAKWGIDPIPDEQTPEGKGSGAERAFSVRNYGMNVWGDLFSLRQKALLITLEEYVRLASDMMAQEGYDDEYRKVLSMYLAFVLDRVADYNTTLCRWQSTWERNTNTFARQALPIVWDYWELNPFSQGSGTWLSMLRQIERAIGSLMFTQKPATITQSSATALRYDENSFDAVLTDPPYYDNIPYSYLSDFFYVWLRRTIGHLYPELFATPLTPKAQEIVAYGNMPGGFESGKLFFEDMLRKALEEIHRVLKPGGIAIIVYAHKSTAGWETLLNSLWDSGLVVTAAWPIHTEMKSRLRALSSAALASSIYMVARKSPREKVGFYGEIRNSLQNQLSRKLDKLWEEGISGADFFISAIGSSIEVFGRFDKILDNEGNTIGSSRILEDVRLIVTEYAVRKVLRVGITGKLSPLTLFYILWRWAYGEASLGFDDARKLAQGVGMDVTLEWNRGFIEKDKENVRLLGPTERKIDELEGSREPIDVLHRLLFLWKRGLNDEMVNALKDSGPSENETLYGISQAIAESLSVDSSEKKLLEGFLQTRTRMLEQTRAGEHQTKLFQ